MEPIRIQRMRLLAERAVGVAIQDHLALADRNMRFRLEHVRIIAMWAALTALRDYITESAISDVGELEAMLSPTGAAETDRLRAALMRGGRP